MTEDPIQERMEFEGGEPTLAPRGGAPAITGLAVELARRLELEQALVFLDLETTGLDPARDRIVELAVARVETDGRVTELTSLVDPGVQIPRPSARVHGIRDEDVRGAPTFPELAGRLARLLRGADAAGYNVERFDLPLLRAELRRAGLSEDWADCRVVDACGIFKRMERRDLSAAYRFYRGGEPAAPHTAAGDVAATMEVLIGQLDRYPDMPRTVDHLDAFWRPPERREEFS